MATNKSLNLSDFGLDDNFDYGANYEGEKTTSKRTPILALGKVAAKGALSGATDGNYIRQAIKKVLPTGYGQAVDFTDDAAKSLKSLYNSAGTEMRPLIQDLKRTTERLIPQMEKVLPSGVTKSLQKWSEATEDQLRSNGTNAQDMVIKQAEQDIFQFEFKQRQSDRRERKAKDTLKEGVDQARFTLTTKQLNAIAMSTQQLADYQTKVTINYQRKALELQYRQFFVARDSFEEQKRMNAIMQEGIRGILHNTGLPDYSKMTEKNRVGSFMRNQFAGQASSFLNDRRAQFVSRLRESVEKTAMDRFKKGIDLASIGLQSVTSAVDGVNMASGIPGDKDDLGWKGSAAEMFGNVGSQVGINQLLGPLRRYLEKNPQIAKHGNTANFLFGNMAQLAQRFSQDKTGYGGIGKSGRYAGVTDPIVQFFKEIAGHASAEPAKTLDRNNFANLQAPAIYTNQANQSIVEVIPGYLARILREIQASRTGDDNTPLMGYDFARSRFDQASKLERNALGGLFSQSSRSTIKSQGADLIDSVAGADKMSAAKRKTLQQELLRMNREGLVGDAKTLTDAKNYTGVNAKQAQEFARLFESHFKDDTQGAKRASFSTAFREFGGDMEERVADIQNLANAGMADMLMRAGIIDAAGNVNTARYAQLHMENDPVAAALDEVIKKRRTRRATSATGKQKVTTMYEDAGLGNATQDPSDAMEIGQDELRRIQRANRRTSKGMNTRQAARSMNSPTTSTSNIGLDKTALDQLSSGFEAALAKQGESLPGTITTATERLHDDLIRIEGLLSKGIGVRRRGGTMSDEPEMGSGARGFFDRSLREHYDQARGAAQEGLARGQAYGGKIWGQGRNILQERMEQLADIRNKGWAKFKDTRNIFMKGEVMPRLMAAKLRAGEYVDVASGKVIESYKDIRGAIKDISTDEIVLTAEEAKAAFVRYGPVQKLITSLGAVIKAGQQFGSAAGSFFTGLQAQIVARAKQGVEMAKDYLDGPQDVYVRRDMKTPAMFARIMRAGGYKLKNEPTKTVMKVTEISGPILDTDGNEVISREDLNDGLFDRFGRPLKTGWSRAIQIGKDYLRRAGEFAKDKLKQGLDMAKDAGKSAREMGDQAWDATKRAGKSLQQWWIANDGVMISGGKTIVERLTQIRDLLNDRLTGKGGKRKYNDRDGDGVRDGSFEDIKRKQKAQHEEDLKEQEEKDIDQAFGKKGKMYALLGGLRDRMGRMAKAEEDGGGHGGIFQDAAGNLLSDAAEGIMGRGKRLAGRGLRAGGRLLKRIPGLGRLATLGGLGGGGLVSGAEAAAAAEGIAGAGGAAASGLGAAGMGAAEAGLGAAAGAGILGKARTLLSGAGRAARVAGTPGRLGTGLVGRAVRAAPGLLWDGVKTVGRAITPGRVGSVMRGLGTAARVLGTPGRIFGGAVADAGMAGLSMAGEAAMAGVGAFLSSSLALPVLGVAALGLAGYGAYKGIHYLMSRKHLDPINTLRYVQYGFAPSDKDHVQAVLSLEDKLADSVVFPQGGIARLDTKKLVAGDLFDMFGVDKKDRNQVHNFADWLINRFKPIYLTHMTVLKKLTGGKDFSKFESLKSEQKSEYINAAKYPDGPYSDMTSPFPDMKSLVSGPKEVAAAAEAALKSFKGKSEDPKKTAANGIKAAVAAAPVVGAVVHPGDMPMPDAVAKSSAEVAAKLKAAGIDDMGNKIKSTTTGKAAITAGVSAAGGMAIKASSSLDPLTCVRMKAYGLTAMDATKVQTLLQLEDLVSKSMSVSISGKVGNKTERAGDYHVPRHVSFAGDPMKVLQSVESGFDVVGVTGDGANNWLRWFMWRFLPTYSTYLAALYTQTNLETDRKRAEAKIVGDPKVGAIIAQATLDAKQPDAQGGASVWRASTSPWKGYALNMDSSSAQGNIEALKKATGRATLKETKTATPKQDSQASSAPGLMDSFKTKLDNAWESIKGGASKAWEGVKTTVSNVGSSVSNAASYAGNAISSTASSAWNATKSAASAAGGAIAAAGASAASGVGNAVAAIGKGLGGKAATLPDPKGQGSWTALKDLITGAAQMVGVDPKLMGTMAAIESGFKWAAKAGTSSATGLYQFISSTWNTMLKKYGPEYGIPPGTPPTDPKANAIMGAQYVKENAAILTNKLKRPLTDTDIYAAHFLGPGGAVQLLTADPNANAVQLMPAAARANAPIFTERGAPRTVGQVIAYLNNLVSSRGRQFGVAGGAPSPTMGQGGDAKPASGSTTTASSTPSPTTGGAPSAAGLSAAPAGAAGGATKDTLAQARSVASAPAASSPSASTAVPVASTSPGVPSAASDMTGFSSNAGLNVANAKANEPSASSDGVHQNQLKVQMSMDDTLKAVLKVLTSMAGKSDGGASPAAASAGGGGSSRSSSMLQKGQPPMEGILNMNKASFLPR